MDGRPSEAGGELRGRLAAKHRYNVATMGIFLLVSYIRLFELTLLALGATNLFRESGALVIVIADVLAIVFVVACGVLAERAVARFRSLNPQFCSIYEPNFWWHERLWKRASSSPTAPRSAPAAPSGSQHSSTMA